MKEKWLLLDWNTLTNIGQWRNGVLETLCFASESEAQEFIEENEWFWNKNITPIECID